MSGESAGRERISPERLAILNNGAPLAHGEFNDMVADLRDARRELTTLRETLREMVDCCSLMRARDETYTASFERTADTFYQETGLIMPGKSAPMEMASESYDDERNARHTEWIAARNDRTWNALAAARAALGEEPAK